MIYRHDFVPSPISQWGQFVPGNCSRLDVTEKSFLNQSTSMTSLDEMDGFGDFESESSEENAAMAGTHNQSQKKSIKTGKSLCELSSETQEQLVVGMRRRQLGKIGATKVFKLF